jgi:hypothetical protein
VGRENLILRFSELVFAVNLDFLEGQLYFSASL